MPGTVRKQKLVKFGYSFGVYFKAWILFKSKIQLLIRYENTIFARKYRQIQRSRSAKVLYTLCYKLLRRPQQMNNTTNLNGFGFQLIVSPKK